MNKAAKIPYPTIERLARYARPLEPLLDSGEHVISSEKLAHLCGVSPAQVRKDLAYFGEFGVRGVGYDISDLLSEIKRIMATDREWKLCLVGTGNLANALLESEVFRARGYRFIAVFDSRPEKVGNKLPCGLIVESTTRIKDIAKRLGIEIGIITVPPKEAQRTADLLTNAGVGAILNYSTMQIRVPDACVIEDADFSVNLDNLAYHLAGVT